MVKNVQRTFYTVFFDILWSQSVQSVNLLLKKITEKTSDQNMMSSCLAWQLLMALIYVGCRINSRAFIAVIIFAFILCATLMCCYIFKSNLEEHAVVKGAKTCWFFLVLEIKKLFYCL